MTVDFLNLNVYDGTKGAFTFYFTFSAFILLSFHSSLWNFIVLGLALLLLAILFLKNFSESESCFSIFVIVVKSFLLKTISFCLKFSDIIAYLTKKPTRKASKNNFLLFLQLGCSFSIQSERKFFSVYFTNNAVFLSYISAQFGSNDIFIRIFDFDMKYLILYLLFFFRITFSVG